MDLLYLVGPPGAGKSTLMAALTAHASRTPRPGPPPHDELSGVAAELGRRREQFSGTDALSMSIQPAAVQWITGRPYSLVLAEGARLANAGFLYAARAAGYKVTLAYLNGPPGLLDERCAARGSTQSAAWRRGAATRAERIAARMALDVTVVKLDAALPVMELITALRGAVPAVEALYD